MATTDSEQQDTRYLLKVGYEFDGDQNDWWQRKLLSEEQIEELMDAKKLTGQR